MILEVRSFESVLFSRYILLYVTPMPYLLIKSIDCMILLLVFIQNQPAGIVIVYQHGSHDLTYTHRVIHILLVTWFKQLVILVHRQNIFGTHSCVQILKKNLTQYIKYTRYYSKGSSVRILFCTKIKYFACKIFANYNMTLRLWDECSCDSCQSAWSTILIA